MQTTSIAPTQQSSDALTTSEPWFRLIPRDGWLTLILLAICVFLTVMSIQSVTPAWAPGMYILTATTGVGLLLGYLVVQQGRLPGALVHTVAILLGIVFSFLQTADAVVHGDRLLLLNHTWVWIQRAVLHGGDSSDNTVFLLFLAVLTFLLAYVSVWLVVHTRRPWLAVLANGVVLLINLNWGSDDKLIFLLLFLLAALLLLVRFTLSENMHQWRARGLRFSPDLSWDFMQAGAIMAVIVLLMAYLLPIGQANAALQEFANNPDGPIQQFEQRWEQVFGGVLGNGPGAGQFNFFDTSLPLTSNVNLSKTQILHYNGGGPRDDPSQYLIAQTLNSYDGQRSWSSTATQDRLVPGNQSLQPSNPHERQNVYQITFDVGWGGTGNAAPAIFAPGSEPASFSLPSDVFFDTRSGAPVTWHSTRPLLNGESYRARGYISTATIQDLEAVQAPANLTGDELAQQYPPDVLALYLPENTGYIPQVIKDAAVTATKGSTSMFDEAQHIQNYLRAEFTYSAENNPDIPGNEDAMTWFFQNKKGFCTFFATAMALMGRSLGLPTRIAEGFSLGSFDAAQKAYIVRGTDTHAWTQIYFGKYGWIDFEPTASFPVFGRATNGSTGSSTPSTAGPNGTAAAQGGPNDHQIDPGGFGGAFGGSGDGPVVRVGLGLSFTLLLLLVLAAAFLVWWRLLYRAFSPTAAAFARVTRLGAWAGAPPRSWQTPSEYADKLSEVLPEQRESLRKLSDLYSAERWGGGTTRDTASDLRRLYDQIRGAATGAIVRRARQLPAMLANALRRIRRSG
jgi:hypothetical protein